MHLPISFKWVMKLLFPFSPLKIQNEEMEEIFQNN